MKDLAVIIVNYNTKLLTLSCLKSIYKYNWDHQLEVFVVDNASSDDSVKVIKEDYPQVKVIASSSNLGFAGGNNVALKQAKARYFLLLNSDTEVYQDSLDHLIDFMDRTNFGIGGCLLLNKDGSIQPSVGDLPFGLPLLLWISGLDDILGAVIQILPSFHRRFKSYYSNEKEVGWVGGAVMIIKNEVVEKIGLLDEKIFMYAEDVEYCLRARRFGFRTGWTDKAKVMHLGGGSSQEPSFKQWVGEFRGLLYIYHKYYGRLAREVLRGIFDLFILARIVAFSVIGKLQVAKTYAKVLISI